MNSGKTKDGLPIFLDESNQLTNLRSLSYKAHKLSCNPAKLRSFEEIPTLENLTLEIIEYDTNIPIYTRLPKNLRQLSLKFANNLEGLSQVDGSQALFESIS